MHVNVCVWVIRRARQCACVCMSLYSGSAVSIARVSIFITLFQGLRVEETIIFVLNQIVDKTNKFLNKYNKLMKYLLMLKRT